ncbi:MAG: 3-dehydroquinate synthase [Spirochaetaceae bacterium]|jgi:3-dehydroquinate synthase|nr:3-dehydroquinate synthase [Spirochaetaceae bacterium]
MAVPIQGRSLLVCDPHTEALAAPILGDRDIPRCVLPPGETAKGWASVERILAAAAEAGLGRDGLFIALGGGVISDLTAFGASIFMRGCRLCIISTTLLGMADAALGGKTGFDLFGIKNLAGTFYPAEGIYMPLEALASLPQREWKSGMAEVIKTAILGDRALMDLLRSPGGDLKGGDLLRTHREAVFELIAACVEIKGRIVEADPRETGTDRALLNLGHTFAHALESAAGLGNLSHGEAVAWGLVRSCELGLRLGITPEERAREISALIRSYGYETAAPHPLMGDGRSFMQALGGDKKKKAGTLNVVIPAARRALLVETGPEEQRLLLPLINGALTLC